MLADAQQAQCIVLGPHRSQQQRWELTAAVLLAVDLQLGPLQNKLLSHAPSGSAWLPGIVSPV